MRRWLSLIALLAFVAPAAAQEPQDWRMAPERDVRLFSFEIQPRVLRLKADEAVQLRFVNDSGQTHRFSAPAFFRNAELRTRDRELLHHGSLTLPPFADETIALVPRAGHYKIRGDNLFRRVLGMTAKIVVE